VKEREFWKKSCGAEARASILRALSFNIFIPDHLAH
jgi:hypothetical protein